MSIQRLLELSSIICDKYYVPACAIRLHRKLRELLPECKQSKLACGQLAEHLDRIVATLPLALISILETKNRKPWRTKKTTSMTPQTLCQLARHRTTNTMQPRSNTRMATRTRRRKRSRMTMYGSTSWLPAAPTDLST